MQAKQKRFLLVAIPLGLAAVGLSVVSMAASVIVTMLGLAVFAYAFTRPTGRTLAHSPCVFCARKIIFEHDAEVCATCNEGVHAACMAEHHMSAHAPVTDAPFR